MGRVRKAVNPYTGKLLDSDVKIERFRIVALGQIKLRYTKFYSLFLFYDEEDIVGEIIEDILRKNIDFDETKKKSYQNFVGMLVEHKMIDLMRYIGGVKRTYMHEVSIDSLVTSDYDEILNGNEILSEVVNDDIDYKVDASRFLGRLRKYFSNSSEKDIKLEEVLLLKTQGHTNIEIAKMLGVTLAKLGSYLSLNRKIIKDLYIESMNLSK